MTHDKKLLLDVGGTFIKCSDGRTVQVNSNGTREEIAGAFREAVGEAKDVAVAIPGPFDYARGIFLMKHKYAAVYGENFASLVSPDSSTAAAGLPRKPRFRYMHDVVAMLLGALSLPESAGFSRVALITIGTGLGFAVSIDGRPQLSASGAPAYSLFNRPYRNQSAEDYVSKRGIMRMWSERTGRPWPSGQTVKDMAGTPDGKAVFARLGTMLGEIAAPLLAELRIECVWLGGQIAKSFGLMEQTLRKGLASVASVQHVDALPNLDTATFDGLRKGSPPWYPTREV